jgi:hypothetical protein
MDTLSYGFQKPETGDKGTTLFTALEDNIQQLNDHSHNGIDSALITVPPQPVEMQDILAVNWVAFGPTGHYRQLITLPITFLFDEVNINFRESGTTGGYIYPTVQRLNNTQYYVYTTDNTVSFVATF